MLPDYITVLLRTRSPTAREACEGVLAHPFIRNLDEQFTVAILIRAGGKARREPVGALRFP